MSVLHKPLVVVGSINADLVATTDRHPVAGETVLGSNFRVLPGGKGANQAVAAARLNYPVKMIGKVGRDEFGAQAKASLQSAGVDIRGVGVYDGSTGVAMITVSSRGENSIVVVPGANADVSPAFVEAHLGTIRGAGMVLTQLEIPLESVLCLAEICRRENIPLMLDPAPAQALPPGLFHCLRWFTPNETEAAFFSHGLAAGPAEIARALQAQGVRGVVLKLGARGSYLECGDGQGSHVQPFSVTAVDTTAAGDAFNGALAAGLMLGMECVGAVRFASAAAAISVTRIGAQPSMPDRKEVDSLLARAQLEEL